MLYESVQEFFVAEKDNEIIGCGALHVLWEDLGEVRTVAVNEAFRGQKIGHQILNEIIERAKSLGLKRLFCLTFETEFFGKNGFTEIQGAPVEADVYQQLLRSYDEGIAEFLDLESVKPNTLGNTRMLKIL
jgi:amino-acid N-acetyltransferase